MMYLKIGKIFRFDGLGDLRIPIDNDGCVVVDRSGRDTYIMSYRNDFPRPMSLDALSLLVMVPDAVGDKDRLRIIYAMRNTDKAEILEPSKPKDWDENVFNDWGKYAEEWTV